GRSLSEEDWFERGLYFLKSQRYDDAIKAFSLSIQIIPNDSQAYNNRGTAWFYKGDYDRAIADCTKALELNPRYADAYHQLALILATCPEKRYRNATKAVALAQKAVELSPEANFLDTLAAAYAEAGRFGDAIATQKRAITFLNKQGKTDEPAEYIGRLNSHKAHKPLREQYVAQLRKDDKYAFEASGEKLEEAMPQQLSKGVVTPNKQGPYPYTIQIWSARYKERANREVMELRKKGDPAFISPAHIPGKGDWYRAFIGYYGTLEEAQKAALALKKRKFRYANVVRKPYAIQVGPSDSDKELKQLEADLRTKGYVTYSIPDRGDNGNIRFLIGAFRTEKEAVRLTKKLQEEGFKPKVVRR
ncbi:MAG: SPOR domain-containing protein, partial [Desulfatiglandaceae bacterium]